MGCCGFSVVICIVLGMLLLLVLICRCWFIISSGYGWLLSVMLCLLLCSMNRLICFGLMVVVFLMVW